MSLRRLVCILFVPAVVSCVASNTYLWRESDFAPLPAGGLAGAPVMILPIMGVETLAGVTGDGDPGPAGRARVDSVIARTLTRRVPSVPWVSAEALRGRAKEDGTVANPDSLSMHQLMLRALMNVPAPLIDQLRSLTTLTQGRYVMAPVRVTFKPGAGGRSRAEFTVLLVDAKVGAVAWKSDVAGEDETPLDALTAALWTLTATPRL